MHQQKRETIGMILFGMGWRYHDDGERVGEDGKVYTIRWTEGSSQRQIIGTGENDVEAMLDGFSKFHDLYPDNSLIRNYIEELQRIIAFKETATPPAFHKPDNPHRPDFWDEIAKRQDNERERQKTAQAEYLRRKGVTR